MSRFDNYFIEEKDIKLKWMEIHEEQRNVDEKLVNNLVAEYGSDGFREGKDTILDVTFRYESSIGRRYIILGGQHRVLALQRWNQAKPNEKQRRELRARIYNPAILEDPNLVAWMTSLNVKRTQQEATLGDKLRALEKHTKGSDAAIESINLLSPGAPDKEALTNVYNSPLFDLLQALSQFPLFRNLSAKAMKHLPKTPPRNIMYLQEILKDAIEQHKLMEKIETANPTIQWSKLASVETIINFEVFSRHALEWNLQQTSYRHPRGLWNVVTKPCLNQRFCFGEFILCTNDLHWQNSGMRLKELLSQSTVLVSLLVAYKSYPSLPKVDSSVWTHDSIEYQLTGQTGAFPSLPRMVLEVAPGIIGKNAKVIGGTCSNAYSRLRGEGEVMEAIFQSIYKCINTQKWGAWMEWCKDTLGIQLQETTAEIFSGKQSQPLGCYTDQRRSPRKRPAPVQLDPPPPAKRVLSRMTSTSLSSASPLREVMFSPFLPLKRVQRGAPSFISFEEEEEMGMASEVETRETSPTSCVVWKELEAKMADGIRRMRNMELDRATKIVQLFLASLEE
ncbi:hypothetical protein FRC14_004886 [Serendipita sp. 396]|nr:hypothetical protein FRC14_004886 [Serendipita sp. 396]KAG8781504.1 hypothetical protein FRC15_008610 [Serendipita sp. 397]KAG8797890.1 hypothetical protein FRC16_008428 [Serendipita sp. 398]KAG8866399.1 hypothetical protein FRC20_008650 [Serendipita sp. 405]